MRTFQFVQTVRWVGRDIYCGIVSTSSGKERRRRQEKCATNHLYPICRDRAQAGDECYTEKKEEASGARGGGGVAGTHRVEVMVI